MNHIDITPRYAGVLVCVDTRQLLEPHILTLAHQASRTPFRMQLAPFLGSWRLRLLDTSSPGTCLYVSDSFSCSHSHAITLNHTQSQPTAFNHNQSHAITLTHSQSHSLTFTHSLSHSLTLNHTCVHYSGYCADLDEYWEGPNLCPALNGTEIIPDQSDFTQCDVQTARQQWR